MTHALVHAPDQHRKRRVSCQGEIAENCKPERKCNRYAGEDRHPDHTDKEDQQVEIAQVMKQWAAEPEQRDEQRNYANRYS